MKYPENWPLDYYLPRLTGATNPTQAAEIVPDAILVEYHLSETSGSPPDTVLIQVFWFRIDRWDAAIQVTYYGKNAFVEGADWLPNGSSLVPRERALRWFERGVL